MARRIPCFGAMMLVLVSAMSYANPVPDFPFVILTERLEKQVAPDVAEVTILLEAFATTSAESLEQLRTAGARVTEVLQRSDIPLGALASSQIDKRAKRASRDGAYKLEILGYEITQGLTLQLADLGKYPSLMNELVSIDNLSSARCGV